ncbi:hypothetical protein E2C01_069292 [Portunus trituberculatus]|uniref:Uncharacterized protein n=1 Tax=Portunus trituberculatus TaxID=210409 RepID=A0A5B7HU56_PORTR|nr:hypothetical protein [Portunus trituberculatus]
MTCHQNSFTPDNHPFLPPNFASYSPSAASPFTPFRESQHANRAVTRGHQDAIMTQSSAHRAPTALLTREAKQEKREEPDGRKASS